jgi:tetratricopeptide (TPR) repeat protein
VYAAAGTFSEGVAEVRLANGDWAVIDRTGTEIQRSSSAVLGVLSEGLSAFVRSGKFGYADARGREKVPATFSGAGLFSENLAPARKKDWGFINKSGNFTIAPVYESARAFSGGLAAFRKDGRWGYLGKNGKLAIKNLFFDARDFSEGLAAVKFNSLWGYIDTGGHLAIAPVYAFAGPFTGGLAAVAMPSEDAQQTAPRQGETRWIDREGATIYRSLRPAGDGLEIILSNAGKYGFAKDNALVIPAEFEGAAGCGSGLCLVKKGGRHIFIDHSGKTSLETDFDEASALDCGLYKAGRQQKYGVIGSTGGAIAQPLYDSIEGSGCDSGLAAVLQGTAGRLDTLTGEFSAGLSALDPPPVKPGEKCLSIEKSLAAMKYAEIPEHCSAPELRTLLGTYPDCLNCRLALAQIHTAADGQGTADKKAALEALAGAIALSDAPAWLHQWRIDLLSPATTQADAVMLLEDYHRLIRLEPYKPEHYRAICRAYGLLKEPPEDIRSSSYYCDLAVKMDTETSENLFNRANFRRLIGNASGALEDLTTLTGLSPKNKEVRLARARLSGEMGQDFRAVFDCSALLDENAGDPDALEERALAYIRMGSCEKALADLESAAKVRPGPGNLHKMAVYRWLCEKNVAGTLDIVRDLLKPAEQCGGSCWRPAEYERYLGDLFGTGTYTELQEAQAPNAPPPPEQE